MRKQQWNPKDGWRPGYRVVLKELSHDHVIYPEMSAPGLADQLVRSRIGYSEKAQHFGSRYWREYEGASGEIAYALRYGLPLPRPRVGSDHGIDFRHHFGTVDVKTSTRANNLLLNVTQAQRNYHADIIVQARFFKATERDVDGVQFICWEKTKKVLRAPVGTHFGYAPAHYIPVQQCRPMHELDAMMLQTPSLGGD